MDFLWDKEKAFSNLAKHSVDFADAVGVFEDQAALTLENQVIAREDRHITLGMDFLGHILVVVYTYRQDSIRLISACRATKKEQNTYERKRN